MLSRDTVKLHERIKRWRKAAGLTQAVLASRCDVSPSAVAQWEDPDGTEPSHDNVQKIAKAVKVTLSQFWGAPPKEEKRAS